MYCRRGLNGQGNSEPSKRMLQKGEEMRYDFNSIDILIQLIRRARLNKYSDRKAKETVLRVLQKETVLQEDLYINKTKEKIYIYINLII